MAKSITAALPQVQKCLVCMNVSAHVMAAGEAYLNRLGILQDPITGTLMPGALRHSRDTRATTSQAQTTSTWWRLMMGESRTYLLVDMLALQLYVTATAATGLAMQVLCRIPLRITGR